MKLHISCQNAITEVQGFDMPDLAADRDPSPEECMQLAAAVLSVMPMQEIEKLSADGKMPIVTVTITRCNGTTVYVHVSDLSQTPELNEWFGEDATGPDECILMIQEPVHCTELGIEFHPIWAMPCQALIENLEQLARAELDASHQLETKPPSAAQSLLTSPHSGRSGVPPFLESSTMENNETIITNDNGPAAAGMAPAGLPEEPLAGPPADQAQGTIEDPGTIPAVALEGISPQTSEPAEAVDQQAPSASPSGPANQPKGAGFNMSQGSNDNQTSKNYAVYYCGFTKEGKLIIDHCQRKVEMSCSPQSRNVAFRRGFRGVRVILRVPVKRRRAMLASNPIEE
jgi:hypothetical protein